MRRISLKVNEEDERIKELGKSFFLYEKAFEEISAEDAESFIANNSSLITIIDNVPNGVSIVTPDYKVVYINKKMRSWFAANGRNYKIRCYRLYHKGQKSQCKECPARVCMETKESASVFHYCDPLDDSEEPMYVHIHAFPILNKKKAPVAFVEYVYNLTEQRQLAETMSALKSQLVLMEKENALLREKLEEERQNMANLERTISDNLNNYVKPALDYLGTRVSRSEQKIFTSLIEESVFPITSSREARGLELSARELQIALLIKEGQSSKQIADTLHVTKKAVDYNRANIRKKLNIHPKANIQTYLRAYL